MKNKQTFTLLELLVVIAIIGVLVSMLTPGLSRARELARSVKCAGNLKQIALGFNIYSLDFDDYFPSPSFEDDDGTTHAGKNLPVLNEKFSATPTRTTYVLKDVGNLPTGSDPREQLKKNEEENFEVESILNQSIRRYNQFCTGSLVVDIAPDFDLHAGDCIHIDVPDTGGGEIDKQISGKYVIASLKLTALAAITCINGPP